MGDHDEPEAWQEAGPTEDRAERDLALCEPSSAVVFANCSDSRAHVTCPPMMTSMGVYELENSQLGFGLPAVSLVFPETAVR